MKELQMPSFSYYLSHPIQYFTPLLRELANRSNLKVYYFSDVSVRGGLDKGFGVQVKWDIPLLEGYESEFIPNYSKREALDNNFLDLLNPSVWNYVRKDSSPVIIINGWSYFSVLLTIVSAKLFGKKVWLRAENTFSKEITKKWYVLFLKKLFLGSVLFRFFIDKCLYIGDDSKAFFTFYKVPERKLVYTPYSVDNKHFSEQASRWIPEKEALKAEFSIPLDRKVILFTGKYMPVKRPLDLLKAFQLLNDLPVSLVMVGDGELRGEMEAFIKSNGLTNIHLTGFVNQGQISKYYAIGDVFVLCSESETWGLSVNEAMNFSMPVVVSDTVGCARNLVKEGVNGYTFSKGSPEQMAAKIRLLLENEDVRTIAGANAAAWVQNFNYKTAVDNMVSAASNS